MLEHLMIWAKQLNACGGKCVTETLRFDSDLCLDLQFSFCGDAPFENKLFPTLKC